MIAEFRDIRIAVSVGGCAQNEHSLTSFAVESEPTEIALKYEPWGPRQSASLLRFDIG